VTHPPTEISLLCGGFGGARFAPALVEAAAPRVTTIITNPGDDADFQSLEVWPDFDSVLYGLAGRFDEQQGWGLIGDSYRCHAALGDAGWFRMGDEDIARSLQRTAWLRDGHDRSDIARRLRKSLGVSTLVVPSAAGPHRTRVLTRVPDTDSERWVPFQEFIVRMRGAGEPLAVCLQPASDGPTPEAQDAARADLVVLGPSNPLFSLMPILATPGIALGLADAGRVVAVSPVVTGTAPRTDPERSRFGVRGRAMELVGQPHTASGAAAFLGGLLDGFVIDAHDGDQAAEIEAVHGIPVLVTDLLPTSRAGRQTLAENVLAFGDTVPPRAQARRATGALASFLLG
jgi:LPPG:FO 2-phospho-L-lactate transferase